MTIAIESVVPSLDIVREGMAARILGRASMYFSPSVRPEDEATHNALEDQAWDDLRVGTE